MVIKVCFGGTYHQNNQLFPLTIFVLSPTHVHVYTTLVCLFSGETFRWYIPEGEGPLLLFLATLSSLHTTLVCLFSGETFRWYIPEGEGPLLLFLATLSSLHTTLVCLFSGGIYLKGKAHCCYSWPHLVHYTLHLSVCFQEKDSGNFQLHL